MIEYLIKSEEEMILFGEKIASILKPSDIITLKGDLGAGKTFLTRSIIRFLCGQDVIVPSPTFNIVQIYNLSDYAIYHYDLYRLKSENELFELAFDDALNGNITIIEWPEIAKFLIPDTKIDINIVSNDIGHRIIKISSNTTQNLINLL